VQKPHFQLEPYTNDTSDKNKINKILKFIISSQISNTIEIIDLIKATNDTKQNSQITARERRQPVYCKTVYCMIKERLELFINENKLLPYRSYAYQNGKSAAMCINDVINVIASRKKNR